MYLPDHFAEPRTGAMHALISANPLGTVVTLGPLGLAADPIPFVLVPSGKFGSLLGHVARSNPLWRDHRPGLDALALFGGPDAYISPTWYPTKQETHQVVPTWNYLTVQAAGPLVVHDDERWVRRQAGLLTTMMEGGRENRWKMGDAPQDYLRTMLANIVGIEIPIRALTGKWKAGQNRVERDRLGAIAGLRSEADVRPADRAMADAMADAMERALAGE